MFVDTCAGKRCQGPRTAPFLADELHALLEERNVKPPYLVVGHSYGGLIAQCFAMQYSENVKGLVLIDPAHEQQYKLFPRDFAFSFKIVPWVFKYYQVLCKLGVAAGMFKFMDYFGLFNFPPTFLFAQKQLRRRAVTLYTDAPVWGRVAKVSGFHDSFRQFVMTCSTLKCWLVVLGTRRLCPNVCRHGIVSRKSHTLGREIGRPSCFGARGKASIFTDVVSRCCDACFCQTARRFSCENASHCPPR